MIDMDVRGIDSRAANVNLERMSSASSNDKIAASADRSPTEAFIRDLYALIAFYVANPDHPRPTHLFVHHAATADQVQAMAARFDRPAYMVSGGAGRLQVDYPAPDAPRVTMMVREPLTGYGVAS